MPDLLTHVLIAYTLFTLLSWRYESLDGTYVTVGMAGALVPDVMKIRLLVPSRVVEVTLGVPFSWPAIHTLGGVLVGAGVGVLLVSRDARRRVGALLVIGGFSHLLADAFLITPSGRTGPLLWPLTRYRPALPGVYLSTQKWPAVVATVVAAVVWFSSRRRDDIVR